MAELAALGIDEADAEDELVLGPAHDLEAWGRLEHEYPLATKVLWQKPDADWDQRRIALSLVHRLTLVLGGNRSGKTYSVKLLGVAMALGGDHPAVRCWLEDNDLPRDLIPDGPGEVYFLAQSASQSIVYHRRDVERLLPATGWTSWALNVPQESRIEISVPGYDRPATIFFKSTDQGWQKFKGGETRLVVISEEPEGENGKLILDECLRGCSSVGGRVVIECTPQHGLTWVYDDLYMQRKYGCQVIELNTEHNVMAPDHASVMAWLETLDPETRAMRQFGKFIDRKGLIYTDWTRGNCDPTGPGHLVKPFPIPDGARRFRAADFGIRDPMVCGWAFEGDDDTVYLYRLYYRKDGGSYDLHADEIDERSKGEKYEGSFGDPSAAEVMDQWAGRDLYFDPIRNRDVESGISLVKDRMRVHGDGRPRFRVFYDPDDAELVEQMAPLIREIENYQWDTNSVRPAPKKKNDHVMDMLRYLIVGIEESRGL